MIQQPAVTQVHFPFKLSAAFSVVVVVVLTLLGANIYHADQVSDATTTKSFRVKELAGIIIHLDEVLTMSARMAAVTGDLEWETRYRRFEPELDASIKEAIRLAPESYSTDAAKATDAANLKLVEMEHLSFERDHQGRLAEAQAILFGVEYEAQKAVYHDGIVQFTTLLTRYAHETISEQRRRKFLFLLTAIAALLALLLAWVGVLWTMRAWQRAFVEKHRQLAQQADELSRLNLSLDRKVAERTQELSSANEAAERSNQELRQHEQVMESLLHDLQGSKEQLERQRQILLATNKQLQELGLLKDEFVAKVSHELRTPLTSIKEGLNLMIDNALGDTNSEQQDFLRTMDVDIDRLSGLINNMLDISKIEAGRMRLQRRRIDLNALLTSLIHSYRPILGHRTATIEAAGAALVFADANRMTQVFSNLLSNAVKFTADDGRVTFRIDRHDSDITVTVEDTGAGIPPEDLPKLFQKFSQVGAQGVGQPLGTGLGLVVCKELTELHGGRIEVASTLGHGSAFTVRLPAYTDVFSLTESVREIGEVASSENGHTFGLLAIRSAARPPSVDDAERQAALEQAAEDVRHHVHGGDIVLALAPHWVVVLAVTDERGMAAMMKRLAETAHDGGALRFGAALAPADGQEAEALFERAVSRVGQGLPSVAPSESR